jgi:hypothetical protein
LYLSQKSGLYVTFFSLGFHDVARAKKRARQGREQRKWKRGLPLLGKGSARAKEKEKATTIAS